MLNLFEDINIHLATTGYDHEKKKAFSNLVSQLKCFPDLVSKMTQNEQNLMQSFGLTIQNLAANAPLNGQAVGTVEVTQMPFKQ